MSTTPEPDAIAHALQCGTPGHGRPFVDIHGHVEASRGLVAQRVDAVLGALSGPPQTALEVAPSVHGQPLSDGNASWLLAETLCYLTHLEGLGRVSREDDAGKPVWRLSAQP